jgi:hypothetical protein
MVINWPAIGINCRKNHILLISIFCTIHQVLYKGINPFQGAMPAFLNIPYKPIRTAIDARINNSKPTLMS